MSEQVANLRDVAHADARLRPDVLWRSAQPLAGDGPPREVTSWPPATVLDLRSAAEIPAGPHPLPGAGVHHVAFAAPDIERAARALQALGAPILPVPANYHDDLAARWGLDDAALTVLQQHALLYDRELPGELPGEFWHLYSEAFQDRFFFEVVQRRGGYAGFGAANASIRAAAQARQHPAEALLF